MANDTPYHVAIVGGGATGLAVLLQLVEKGSSGMRIALLEKKAVVGPGLAYSGACAGTRLNMNLNTMSLTATDPDHFARWMKSNPCNVEGAEFPPRDHYGKYLVEVMADVVALAEEKGIALSVLNAEVVDMEQVSGGWSMVLATGATLTATDVALALGNYICQIHKRLNGKPLYFDYPWPNSKLLAIPKTASVAVLGSRLTAIDEALYLYDQGYTGKIYLLSRTGELPKIQATARQYNRGYTLYNLARELETSSKGSIITIARRIHDEMRRDTFSPNSTRASTPTGQTEAEIFAANFRADVEMAERGMIPGQAVLRDTAPIIERYWNALTEMSQQAFLREYISIWTTHRHAMPMRTGKRLLRLLESGQLRVLPVNTKKQIEYADGEYTIPVNSSEGTITVNSLIEATGLEFETSRIQTPLFRNLLSKKILTPHPAGGFNCDFHTLEARKGLYVIGSMTRGVHFYSTSIDRTAAHSERVADNMLGVPLRKPLHVALFAGQDLFSQLMLSQLVPRLVALGQVPFIYLPSTTTTSTASSYMQTPEVAEMNFFEQDLLHNTVIPTLGSSTSSAGPCLTVEQLRTRYGVLVQSVPDVNDRDFVRSLSTNYIDLGFSLRSPQQFGAELVQYFRSASKGRRGLYNLHPGNIPMSTPEEITTLNAMTSGEQTFRYSLYEVSENSKSSDTLVGVTESLPIEPSQALLNAMDEFWRMGVDLVVSHTDKMARGQSVPAMSQIQAVPMSRSNTLPTGDLKLVDAEGMKQLIVAAFAPAEGANREELEKAIEDACLTWYKGANEGLKMQHVLCEVKPVGAPITVQIDAVANAVNDTNTRRRHSLLRSAMLKLRPSTKRREGAAVRA